MKITVMEQSNYNWSMFETLHYIHTDHLGSYVAFTNTYKQLKQRHWFDPWGKSTNHLRDFPPMTMFTLLTPRGFTGHEHYPEFCIINMNGRLYDPVIGRFFSPDNFVQTPEVSQGFNRYSYCLNNPLKYVDPSGELFSPYYDYKGNFLGLDEFGWSGNIYVTSEKAFDESATNGVADSKIIRTNVDTKEIYGFRHKLTKNVIDNILNHVAEGTKLPYGEGSLKTETYNINRTVAATSNGMYNGKMNGVHQMDFSASDYEWTVENIRGLVTHEIWGHGIKGYGDKTKNHHLIYQGQMDSPYWEGATDRYKSHTVDTYYNYFYYEKGTNIVPDPYYSKLLKHLKIKP